MKQLTVLVVEDNLFNLKLVRSLLKLKEINVLEAVDAEQGIILAEAYTPDLILMDIQLPGMDGLVATAQIKKNPALSRIPIIALTSHAMRGDEEKALKAGCDGYITKPINTRSFFDMITKATHMDIISELPKHSSPTKNEPNYASGRILVVDDDPKNVKLMSAILNTAKYKALEAFDGHTALKIAMKDNVDLILLDLMMPGLDGYQVLEELKKKKKTKNIPVVIVSALSNKENKIQGIGMGADEYLTKPINKIELLARVKSLLKLRQYQDQLKNRIVSAEFFSTSTNEEFTSQLPKSPMYNTILIVEDDDKDIKLYRHIIGIEDYRVLIAKNGQEAFDLLGKETIDLVLLDLIMPDMSGLEVCEKIRNQYPDPTIQIIMITCIQDIETKIKSLEIGADEFLVKPIDAREVKARIKVLLKKRNYMNHLYETNKRALGLAIIDPLTGLFNQSYLKHYLKHEIERTIESSHLLGLMMIDLDDFKKYNDTLGHPTGDFILKSVAEIIKEHSRDLDLCARYGGEEYVVVLPNIGIDQATKIAEETRMAISKLIFDFDETSDCGQITASIGLSFCPLNAQNIDDLIETADQLLYQAKRTGKNRVYMNEGGASDNKLVAW